MKTLTALFVFAFGLVAGAPAAMAQDSQPAKKHTAKKSTAKKAAPADSHDAAGEGDDKAPEVSNYSPVDYDCELGNKLTIYRSPAENDHIALRWKKQLLRLDRVSTTTGANRFENRKIGLVWIDIPAKGMLLDSKKGHQLANECRSPEQLKATAEAAKG
ncbi:hypothetical protein E4K72_15185 [Oxalobacteraceae bacterium OM1]|nr:hypothetical protein E4K72_15185 [Oxalobacteraceae bacterium OM1]